MAAPAGTTAKDSVKSLVNMWRSLRVDSVAFIAQCTAGSLDAYNAAAWLTKTLASYKVSVAAHAAVSGVAAALQAEYPGKLANEAAATTAISDFQTAINTLIVYMETNLPKESGTQRLAVEVLANDGSGSSSHRTITNGTAIANFKAALEAFRDSIDVS